MIKENHKSVDVFDIHAFIALITKNWLWIGLSCFLLTLGTYIFLKTKNNIYQVQTSVIVYEENNGMAAASSQILTDMGFTPPNKNFINELMVLRSTPLVKKAVSSLDFQVSYYEKEQFRYRELYQSTPFIVILNQEYPQPIGCKFDLKIIDENSFQLQAEEEDIYIMNLKSEQVIKRMNDFEISEKGEFDKVVANDNMRFKIILNSSYDIDELKEKTFSFMFHSQKGLVKSYRNALEVEAAELESTIANITIYTDTPRKGIDFLNSITQSYIEMESIRKKHISEKTVEYINNQLNNIQTSLQTAEQNLQEFRSENELIDITMQSGQIFQELQKMENEKAILEINLKYYTYMDEYFHSNNEIELIAPKAMGIDDPMLNNLVEQLITFDAERSSLIENNQEKSPYLRQLNIRIENLKSKVAENITYYKQTNNIALRDLDARINQLNREIRKLPKTQQELLGFERQFNINDAIYSYLLERKAEAEIASASYQTDVEVLEPAEMVGTGAVYPKKKMLLLGALFAGLIIPIAIFHLLDRIRITFQNADEVKQTFSLPFAGEIFTNNKKTDAVVKEFPSSHVAESFKRLRMHLQYFLKDQYNNIIAISSTVSQEGKSFISLNLAFSLANSGRKTILLGFDLRKPKLFSGLDLQQTLGLSEYLSFQAGFEDIIQKTPEENLDAIWAGAIPPNPAELIASKHTDKLFEYLKENYEYILIDTPPIGILSEGFTLYNKADVKLFVTRLNRPPMKDVKHVIGELDAQKMENVAMVINGVTPKNRKRYGYGYYEENKNNLFKP